MTETVGGSLVEKCGMETGFRGDRYVDWLFRILLVFCLVPSLWCTAASIAVFAHDPPGLTRALWRCLPTVLACTALLLPWRRLLAGRAGVALTFLAACVAAHQVYGSFRPVNVLPRSFPVFAFCCLVLLAGAASFLLHVHRRRQKTLHAACVLAPVLACFVIGAGNPQWSRFIFIWQVHYSPWRMDAENLPTNRRDVRATLPKYTEWDAKGRKLREWTHPGGKLLRTEYYPDGRIRMERLHVDDPQATEELRGTEAHR